MTEQTTDTPALLAEAMEALGTAVAAADVFRDGGDIAAIEAFEDWLPKASAILARYNSKDTDHGK